MTGVSESAVAQELTQLSREAFDLARGPLLRLHTIKTGSDQHIVLLAIHHIVSDAWSLNILFGELMTFYDARRQGQAIHLPDLPIQFADFAIWQRNWLAGGELERQLDYWKTRLEGAPPAINLPTDHAHPPVQKYNGAITSRLLKPELKTRLEALARHPTLPTERLQALPLLLDTQGLLRHPAAVARADAALREVYGDAYCLLAESLDLAASHDLERL